MNVDPDIFLRHFGSSIRNSENAVNGREGGMRCNCPLHGDSDFSMSVSDGESPVFSCCHPSCGFRGDAVSLLSVARRLGVREAVDAFRPGGEFSDCMRSSMRADEFDSLADAAMEQMEIRSYLAKCSQALKRSPERARIRPGMSATTARLLHPCAGLFLGSGAPKQLKEFCRPKYRGSCLVLYPYTCDGEVTKIDVVDVNNPVFRQTVAVTHPSVGVFGEDLAAGGSSVVVAERPDAAAAFYATWMLGRVSRPRFASFQGYPLPESFSSLSSVTVASTSDCMASTGFLLHMLSAPEVVRGRNPDVRVAHFNKRANEVSDTELELMLQGAVRRQFPLHEAVARRFVDMARRGQTQDIAELLSREQTPLVARALIRDALSSCLDGTGKQGDREAAAEASRILSSESFSISSDVRLANGRTVHRTPTETVGVTAYGKRETLCNVGLSVDYKNVSFDGRDIYSCTVTHSDEFPPVQVRLGDADLSSASRMQAAVARAYSARGYNPYVAFYQVKGFSWRDVVARLSEHCQVSREVGELGLDSASDIQLPDVTVRSNGSVARQSKVFTIPDDVLRVYAGIPMETEASAEPYRALVSKCDNLYVAAFALGVMHVVYQMTYGMFRPNIVKSHAKRHLFYVETEPGIWGRVFKQVADLFSGNDFTPTVNYSDPGRTFSTYSQLGCLPLIAYVPTMGGRLASALDESGSDLIGLLDTSTAVMANGRVSAVYVTPSEDSPMDRGIIDGRDLDALRRSFVPFLVKFVREAAIDTAYRSSSVPCIAAYDECCRIFGADRSHIVDNIAKNYFPGVGMTGLTIFCDLVHRSLSEDAPPHLGVVQGPPQRGHSFTRRGQHVFVMRDCVIVSHMVVDMYNNAARGRYRFDVGQITDELESTDALAERPEDLGLDWTRCWCLSREAWETRMVRPPVNLASEVTNGTIKLERI